MSCEHPRSVARRLSPAVGAAGGLLLLLTSAACDRAAPRSAAPPAILRIGVGRLPLVATQAGLRQLVNALAFENLVIPMDDGRLQPWLAEGWTMAPDGLSIDVRLRDSAKFHDGSPVTSALVAQSLRKDLPGLMGPAFEDIETIDSSDPHRLHIVLRRPSSFVLEALEPQIVKPGKTPVGTGPFVVSASSASGGELRANPDYYLGPPGIDRVSITPYPSVRSAWAELLRGNIDMLHEVNIDALDSLQASNDVGVFSYLRHYQYMIAFGRHAPMFQSAEVRRELSAALDRDAIVREALNGHGVASTGPVPPAHWSLSGTSPRSPDKKIAGQLAARHLKFTCVVPADSVYERLALAVRRQLAAVGVDMQVQEATQEQAVDALSKENYDAILLDVISGPTLFRSYRHWYSRMAVIPRAIPGPAIDAALDSVRRARTEEEYRAGVTAFERAIDAEPPALFLAWGERARAVSRRFEVVVSTKGRDPLNVLRLWHPAGAPAASTN